MDYRSEEDLKNCFNKNSYKIYAFNIYFLNFHSMKFASIFSKKIFFILSIWLAFFAQTFAADLYYAGTNSVWGDPCHDADCIESVSQPNPGDTAHIGDGGQLTLSNTIDYNLELSGTAQINILDSATIATGTSSEYGLPSFYQYSRRNSQCTMKYQ